jgi:hypothetical protein
MEHGQEETIRKPRAKEAGRGLQEEYPKKQLFRKSGFIPEAQVISILIFSFPAFLASLSLSFFLYPCHPRLSVLIRGSLS